MPRQNVVDVPFLFFIGAGLFYFSSARVEFRSVDFLVTLLFAVFLLENAPLASSGSLSPVLPGGTRCSLEEGFFPQTLPLSDSRPPFFFPRSSTSILPGTQTSRLIPFPVGW